MSDFNEMLKKQLDRLKRELADAIYKGESIRAERLNKEIGRICSESHIERGEIEKKDSCL